ncbi:hypothetical protein COK00_26475 [Bacillus cereus]|uniref:Uncharacterized protein n=1 Tax=Bacillus cereus TaxID=1396 RepID=A0A2A8Y3W1_BACCE|nr:hypothetical protein CON28_15880 [Bacillus cereus]PEQ53570.1 hypothetical protein CN468_00045 [Bacillus cereus]PEX35493.1 hypothetical protein CN455_23250 [Bacillus cereus]PFB09720.1 hypothetical protein CN399_30125 [Bacillus cereus]PFB66315.1 hypothetical protein CN291_11925 [Bacillus cereus]
MKRIKVFSKTGNSFIIIRKFYKFLINQAYSLMCVNILKKANTMFLNYCFLEKICKILFLTIKGNRECLPNVLK